MSIDLSDRVQRLMAFRLYERDELEYVTSNVHEGDVVFDIGAHVGYYALHAASRVGVTGAVYAFEPVPSNAEQIRMNKDLNSFDQLHVVQAAVGDREGTTTFQTVTSPGESGWGSTVLDPSDTTVPIDVELVSLDTYALSRGITPVRLIKMDVQGGELQVLTGAATLLSRDKPEILCELVDVWWGMAQKTTAVDILKFLDGLGYSPWRIEHGSPPTPLALKEAIGLNVLFRAR